MLKIGLTGGIGSGKTTVANFFEKLGVAVIDSDVIAHELTSFGQPAYSAILNRFGPEVVASHGKLNRKKLREIIFNDVSEKQWLEELLHPLIKQEIAKTVANLKGPYCIIVIPLLIEAKLFDIIDRVLVVDTSIEEQIRRTTQRDDVSSESVMKIISAQASREERLTAATDVIYNDSDISHLKHAVTDLHKRYTQLGKLYACE